MATEQSTKNFKSLKRQTFFLSILGNIVRIMIIALIPAAFGTVIYICTVGAVWPWTVDPIKSWIAGAHKPKTVIKADGSVVEEEPTETDGGVPPATISPIVIPDKPIEPPTVAILPPAPPAIAPPSTPPPALPAPVADKRLQQLGDLQQKLADAVDDLNEAVKKQDKWSKKIASAKANVSLAETKVQRAKREFNSATDAYQNRAQNGIQRGLGDALARLQVDVDRAKRHVDESVRDLEDKQALWDSAKNESKDAEKDVHTCESMVTNFARETTDLAKALGINDDKDPKAAN